VARLREEDAKRHDEDGNSQKEDADAQFPGERSTYTKHESPPFLLRALSPRQKY
jgi:hypothetical protein